MPGTPDYFAGKTICKIPRGGTWVRPTRGIFMARLVQRLTEAKIRRLTKIGLHHDGAGLYCKLNRAARSPGSTDSD